MRVQVKAPYYNIGGINFIIEQDGDWYWTNEHSEGLGFKTQSEALEDAMRWVKAQEAEAEEEREAEQDWRQYKSEVTSLWEATRL